MSIENLCLGVNSSRKETQTTDRYRVELAYDVMKETEYFMLL